MTLPLTGKLCLLMLLITGCASIPMPERGPLFTHFEPPSSTQALVYVYRNGPLLERGGPNRIYANGVEQARLDNRGYATFPLASGCHELSHDWPGQQEGFMQQQPLTLCVENGSRHIIRVLPNRGTYSSTMIGYAAVSSGRMRSSLVRVSEDRALEDSGIQDCRYYPAFNK